MRFEKDTDFLIDVGDLAFVRLKDESFSVGPRNGVSLSGTIISCGVDNSFGVSLLNFLSMLCTYSSKLVLF